MSANLEKIPDVDIDPAGKFKYILIQVTENESKQHKTIVRGYKTCEYHADILDLVEPSIKKHNCEARCLGGGRIRVDPSTKSIFIFGYSQGFGRANHEVTQALIKKKYPDFREITWSNDGY